MSQVGMSRPLTQQGLPEILHPLSRLSNPDSILVGKAGGFGRPLTAEQTYPTRRSRTVSRQTSRGANLAPLNHESIPDGVEVQTGDPNKTRLPIFGNRRELSSRGELGSRAGRAASRLSTASAQNRLEIDELEAILKEKVRTNFHEIKKTFKNNDPENKGNLSREALHRALVTVVNRPITHSQYQRLMDRLGFGDRTVVSFPEFFSLFRQQPEGSTEHNHWMDPVHRQVHDKLVTSTVVHLHLREKAQRVKELHELIPGLRDQASILRMEFRDALDNMGFPMDDAEFTKLWAKYDADGIGAIDKNKLFTKLGVAETNGDVSSTGTPGSGRPLRKKELERQRSLDIEKWLKKKFREGFSQMKAAFEEQDSERSGMIEHHVFMDILAKYGLRLDMDNLAVFLARCSVQPTRTHVPYRDFLHRFQDRSDQGMAHKVLSDNKHRYNRPDSPGSKSTLSAMETQLINMFQRDFLSLLGTFHKIDRYGMDFISQEEFRAAIESRFDLELTDQQFQLFIDQVPLDAEGNVLYAEFMAQFDTKGKAKSLFENSLNKARLNPIGALPRDPSPLGGGLKAIKEEELSPEGNTYDRLIVEDSDVYAEDRPQRSPQELFKIIKALFKKSFQAIEGAFYEIDELNSGRLTQEMMYRLLKRLGVKPDATRGEIRQLWKTFIINQDKSLNFNEFTRHFGYSPKSAAFPNAKVNPPTKGDSDFRLRSKRLNCAADMLQDSLRSNIDYMWDDLHKEFTSIDPYNTGFINADEFRQILQELCVHLTDYELEMLTSKFMVSDDGRVSYVEFLKPFAMKRQMWRTGNNMIQLLQHSQDPKHNPNMEGLDPLTAKLRHHLTAEWRGLKRAFKKLDKANNGHIPLSDFRAVLQLTSVPLNDEEIYQVMSKFDENLSGKIAYNRFLTEALNAPGTSAGRAPGTSAGRAPGTSAGRAPGTSAGRAPGTSVF